MFGQMYRQVIRNFTSKSNEIRRPRGYEKVGSNLPFDINNVNALTFKFILFFGTAFNLPFFALYWQLNKGVQSQKIKKQLKEPESTEIYGLVHDEQEKKPEIYL